MAERPKKELGGPRQMSTGTKVIIAIFAVFMAVSMMLPSLAPIFASGRTEEDEAQSGEEAADQQDAEGTEEGDEEDADSDATESDEKKAEEGKAEETDIPAVPENETLKNLAEQHTSTVEKFQKRLEEDPNNLAALLNLGQEYMNWGYSARYSSTTDEETAYAEAIVNKAIGYYNRYLALHDSDSVKIQLALCNYYLGKTEEAVASLTTFTEEHPENPLGWANLGMLYEQQYEQDKAIEVYQKAIETDPNDEYGAKSYADEHIASINASRTSFEDLTNEELLGTNAKPQEGLPGIIASESGI